jgi:hypothetical protein
MHATPAHPALPLKRLAYAAIAVALLTAAVVEIVTQDTGLWQFFAFGAAPDLALFVGIAPNLAKGQLHPRAVPLYNALHRIAGPIVLAVAATVGPLAPAYLVAALAWGLHIAVDRAAGYELRTPDGFQRS